jgi:hypothetical protein
MRIPPLQLTSLYYILFAGQSSRFYEQNLPAAGKKVKGIFIPFVENIMSIAEKGGFAVANTLPGDRCFCCQLLSCIL